jgi:hypothetical protein
MNDHDKKLNDCFPCYVVLKVLVKQVSCPQGESAELRIAHVLNKCSWRVFHF